MSSATEEMRALYIDIVEQKKAEEKEANWDRVAPRAPEVVDSRLKVSVEVRGPMRDLFLTKDDVVISAAAGTGKTFQTLFWLHIMLLKYPGTRAMIIRKVARSLTGTTLETYRSKVAKEAIDVGIVQFYTGSAAAPAGFRYKNGSRIVVGGLDEPQKIMGSEVSIIVIDEAIETTQRDFDMLRTRLRGAMGSAYPHYRMVLLTNPGPPTHYLRSTKGLRIAYSTHKDNPAFYDKKGEVTSEGHAYLSMLSSLTGVQRQRLYEGKWAAAEGVIWTEYDPGIHLVDKFEVPSEWPRYWAVDFGFVHPFVAQWWAEDPDGNLYLYRELVHTKRLVEDHAKQMLSVVTNEDGWLEPKPKAILTDHAAEDRATLEKHLGLKTKPAKKTVGDGLQAVASRLKVQANGKPRLMIMRDCLIEEDPELARESKPMGLAQEIPSYIWADHKTKEEPVKVEDDACDCARYVVAHLDLNKSGNYNFRSL